jgi:FlaA1/EpsC-like NDP-sugar epimerase
MTNKVVLEAGVINVTISFEITYSIVNYYANIIIPFKNESRFYCFDMGKSVKIVDVAKKMIKLSGLELGKDIQIIYSGLRPGEKLYEELLANSENTIPTKNSKILKAKVRKVDATKTKTDIEELISLTKSEDNMLIVTQMKKIVPEFLSKNSDYEVLD